MHTHGGEGKMRKGCKEVSIKPGNAARGTRGVTKVAQGEDHFRQEKTYCSKNWWGKRASSPRQSERRLYTTQGEENCSPKLFGFIEMGLRDGAKEKKRFGKRKEGSAWENGGPKSLPRYRY